jgi:hypothetical protein
MVREPPRVVRTVWMIFAARALAMILVPLLAGCASPCMQSEEIVTVLAVNETHIMQLRGRVELCPR